MEPVTEGNRANSLICKLAGFLLASISKSEKEWTEWSQPFLLDIYKAQFGDIEGEIRYRDMDSAFSPVLGKGIALWTESLSEHEDESEYLLVHTAEQHLLQEFISFSEQALQQQLDEFSRRFMQFILSKQGQDARTRTVARKLSRMLYGSAQTFSDLERTFFLEQQQISSSTYGDIFKETASNVPKSSLLVSYRMWRVGFTAVGGGALVGLAGALAAPTIMVSIIPIFATASSFLQMSIAMETYLAYFGIATATSATTTAITAAAASPAIPTFFAAYGAIISGQTMMKRTEELGEFDLLPLHIPTHDHGSGGNRFALSADASNSSNGGPLYILVPGHMDKNVDLRALWGANGSVLVLPEETHENDSPTATAENSKADTCSTPASTSPLLPAHTDHSIVQDVIEHEVHVLKSRIVQRMHDEVTHDLLPILPTALHIQDTVRAEVDQLAYQATHTTRDEVAEEDWENLKLRYQGWWRDLVSLGEEYVLQWETMLLTALNDTFYDLLYNELRAHIVGKIKDTLFAYAASALYPLKKALALPKMVLGKIKELDGSWVRAMDRARQAGHLLARTLYNMKNKQPSSAGEPAVHRPVTLIGYGMGARLIFHCLEHLYDISLSHRQRHQPHSSSSFSSAGNLLQDVGEDVKGIVEHAILLGAPVSTARNSWCKARLVVADRLVNGYARFDWMLALMYRVKSYELGVAGLYPVHLHDESKLSISPLLSANDGVPTTSSSTDTANASFAYQPTVPMISRVCGISSPTTTSSSSTSTASAEEVVDDDEEGQVMLMDDDFDEETIERNTAKHNKDTNNETEEQGKESTDSDNENDTADAQSIGVSGGNAGGQILPTMDFAAVNFTELQDIENIDLSDIISVHADYPKLLYTILNLLKV